MRCSAMKLGTVMVRLETGSVQYGLYSGWISLLVVLLRWKLE